MKRWFAVLHALLAFRRARRLSATLDTRPRIIAHQRRRSEALVRHARRKVPFYRGATRFEDAPVIDKASQQAALASFNSAGISAEAIAAALAVGVERINGYYVGQSTGTTRNRGRFVISDSERFEWLGTIVAKTIPDAFFRRTRVALALPGLSALYRSASVGSRIRLAFFDLSLGVHAWRDGFAAFDPEVVVAPPKVLRILAEEGLLVGVEAFSGAEVLDPLDRGVIESATGRPVREIYMATEGLFGVGCRFGNLHVAEDVVRFEWERVGTTNLHVPIVTDLVRRIQPMIRYRMNDLLELSDRRCPCGSAFQVVERIHGRMDDMFLFEVDGRSVPVTPDVLRNAVVDSDPSIRDFRLFQRLDGTMTLTLPDGLPKEVAERAREGLSAALSRFGVVPVIALASGIVARLDRKLRRVERERVERDLTGTS